MFQREAERSNNVFICARGNTAEGANLELARVRLALGAHVGQWVRRVAGTWTGSLGLESFGALRSIYWFRLRGLLQTHQLNQAPPPCQTLRQTP